MGEGSLVVPKDGLKLQSPPYLVTVIYATSKSDLCFSSQDWARLALSCSMIFSQTFGVPNLLHHTFHFSLPRTGSSFMWARRESRHSLFSVFVYF